MENAPQTTPKKTKLERKEYEEELLKLQIKLCKLQEWVRHKGLRIIVIFEGRDAAGKGGAIVSVTRSPPVRLAAFLLDCEHDGKRRSSRAKATNPRRDPTAAA